jgi:hypothetical protein
MNVLLWILQGAMAFMFFSGGAWKIFQYEQLAKMPQMAALPKAGWYAVGALEIAGAVLLIVPAATGWLPVLTPVAAAALALESLALAALYARYSLAIAATNPMVWAATMGVLAGLVACGRYARLG